MINLILWNFPGEEGYPRLATILEIGFHGTTIKKIGLGSLGYIYIYSCAKQICFVVSTCFNPGETSSIVSSDHPQKFSHSNQGIFCMCCRACCQFILEASPVHQPHPPARQQFPALGALTPEELFGVGLCIAEGLLRVQQEAHVCNSAGPIGCTQHWLLKWFKMV